MARSGTSSRGVQVEGSMATEGPRIVVLSQPDLAAARKRAVWRLRHAGGRPLNRLTGKTIWQAALTLKFWNRTLGRRDLQVSLLGFGTTPWETDSDGLIGIANRETSKFLFRG